MSDLVVNSLCSSRVLLLPYVVIYRIIVHALSVDIR